MSSTAATFIALGMYAAAFAPLILIHWSFRASMAVAASYAVLALLLSVHLSGILQPGVPKRLSAMSNMKMLGDTNQQCAEAIRIAEESRIILDRSQPSRLVVQEALWKQLPELARNALTHCVEELRSDGRAEGALVVDYGTPG